MKIRPEIEISPPGPEFCATKRGDNVAVCGEWEFSWAGPLHNCRSGFTLPRWRRSKLTGRWDIKRPKKCKDAEVEE